MTMMATPATESDEREHVSGEVSKMPPRMTSVDDSVMLPEWYEPKEEDCICSWARQNHSHPGNERFRTLIEKYAPIYLRVSTKYQKSEVIAKIVAEVRIKSPGGGFVKKDFYSGRWFEIGDEKARDKVGHAIRKAAAELSKKHSGEGKHQSAQKRRMKRSNDNASPAASCSGQIPFHPSVMHYDMMPNMDHALASRGADMRADRATTSFLGPIDATLPSSTGASSLHSSLHVAASDVPNSLSSYIPYASQAEILTGRRDFSGEAAVAASMSYDLGSLYSSSSGALTTGVMGLDGTDDSNLMNSLQRRRLLVGAAKKQQEAIDMLRQSSEMTRFAQASGVASGQFPGSSLGDFSNLGDMAQQERMAVYATGAQSIGNLMGLAGSIAAPGSAFDMGSFDPQTIMTSHLAATATQYNSFLSPSGCGQLQLPRVTDTESGLLQRAPGGSDGNDRQSFSKNERDQSRHRT